MAYDEGTITAREHKAAKNQTAISKQNVRDVQNQLARQLSNYDFADAQNRALADTQLDQNSRKTSADRYETQRDLQAATLGLLGSMGSAMNGSTTGNLMSMLRSATTRRTTPSGRSTRPTRMQWRTLTTTALTRTTWHAGTRCRAPRRRSRTSRMTGVPT